MRLVEHVKKLIKTMEALDKVLVQENEYMRDMNLVPLKALQSKKFALSKNYESLATALPLDSNQIKEVDIKIRKNLKKAYIKFKEELRENSHLILATKKNTERYIEIYRSSPELKKHQTMGYNRQGDLKSRHNPYLSYQQVL
jgi:hypothetical protein